jgi:hypothetical protein
MQVLFYVGVVVRNCVALFWMDGFRYWCSGWYWLYICTACSAVLKRILILGLLDNAPELLRLCGVKLYDNLCPMN